MCRGIVFKLARGSMNRTGDLSAEREEHRIIEADSSRDLVVYIKIDVAFCEFQIARRFLLFRALIAFFICTWNICLALVYGIICCAKGVSSSGLTSICFSAPFAEARISVLAF